MVYSLTYRRPPHVDSSSASFSGVEKTRSIGGSSLNSQSSSSVSFGIPDALSFDRIIAGGTCPVSSSTAKSTTNLRPRAFLVANDRFLALHHA